jgi:hypothetical protein
MTDKAIIRPEIKMPDLSMFGVDNFKAGYDKFGPAERQVLWQTLLKVGFEVASGKGVSGSNYCYLLTLLKAAFPNADIDESVFDQIVPNVGLKRSIPAEKASAGGSRSDSDTHTQNVRPAPAVFSQKQENDSDMLGALNHDLGGAEAGASSSEQSEKPHNPFGALIV